MNEWIFITMGLIAFMLYLPSIGTKKRIQQDVKWALTMCQDWDITYEEKLQFVQNMTGLPNMYITKVLVDKEIEEETE